MTYPPGRSVAIEPTLSPYSFQIGWETLKIYRVGEENSAPSSAFAAGQFAGVESYAAYARGSGGSSSCGQADELRFGVGGGW